MSSKEVLIASEVAERLRIDTQRVYELVRTDPHFPFIKLGERQYRFLASSVQEYLEKGGSKQMKEEN